MTDPVLKMEARLLELLEAMASMRRNGLSPNLVAQGVTAERWERFLRLELAVREASEGVP